jgi:hypothetical protein
MYSWAALFLLLAYYACYMIMEDDNRRSGYVLFSAASILAAYTHYYTIIPLAVMAASVFVFLFVKKRKILKFIAAISVSIILYLPWINTVIRQFQHVSGGFSRENPGLAKGLCYFFWQGNAANSGVMLIFNVLYSGLFLVFATTLIFWLMWRSIKKMRENSESEVISFAEAYWIFSGYAVSTGTVLALELISILLTPTLAYRYLHPVVGLMWLAFSVAVSKLKKGNLIAGIMTVLTLLLAMPMYIETYKSDVEADMRSRTTQKMMLEKIGADDLMLTNIEHLEWSILQYYLPEISHKYVSEIKEIEPDRQYWILWSDSLNESTLNNIKELNYHVVEKCQNCELGSTAFHLYKFEK